MSEKELKEASIEFVNYALATCPYCSAETDVSTCDTGVMDCVCGNRYFWSTST